MLAVDKKEARHFRNIDILNFDNRQIAAIQANETAKIAGQGITQHHFAVGVELCQSELR
jgi:hypothetical protein